MSTVSVTVGPGPTVPPATRSLPPTTAAAALDRASERLTVDQAPAVLGGPRAPS